MRTPRKVPFPYHVPKPSKQYRILEKDGSYGFISQHRAEACLAAGFANLVREKVIRFVAQADTSSPRAVRRAASRAVGMPALVRQSPTIGRITSARVDQFSGSDSGFSLLPYPMPCGITSSPKFPGLFKVGAGLL